MARIAYDSRDAAAFAATRHLPDQGLAAWRAAVARHLQPRPGMRMLDLGAGTGMWAAAFTDWYDDLDVIAVEPAEAMRARCTHPHLLPGEAADIPLPDDSVDAAWLSTVVHHVPDLTAAARELRRVVRGGGPVLIRSAFAGRHQAIGLFRFFPEAIRVLGTYPSVGEVEAAFGACGFAVTGFEQVPQTTSPSLREFAANLRREAHTPLQLITDDEYAAGLARLHRAARSEQGPVIDALDLLVLR
ncbi:methyltransferase domain-containing protein [Micromonospora sp. DR5-3]|uniref:class I SAM-dependent methyltransferase n=1 Tax=unclassified Micromonospora TaxID=2617518 RepID=UPI0011D8C3D6|nr:MULTISPECIES: methyltransferase domain-containing protein [unclassified Micromonospora]MCW3819338.1 methyltransferase domain-containing protein [Micromonospora sp. DR5-3]TYC21773.1 methyltransferase domain-containing protein [Micromonospora sp. MP36]